LETIREKLSARDAKKSNHRIALFGMGGIGKTQCALGYVYTYRNDYERIYWITAVNQAQFMEGHQKIAKDANLPGLENAPPSEVVKAVQAWLGRQRRWLLVVDNLDDIRIAKDTLPENGPGEHTIITTRNAFSSGIPAEPLEVPLLDKEESIVLLSTLSNIQLSPGSQEEQQAANIVDELRYLPLAIEQAAAYVREVTDDFGAYCDEYHKNRKKLHRWEPTGNRQYDHSVAEALSLSFNKLQKNATGLLQLFAYMNPDGILIEFLQSGAKALNNDLREVVLDLSELAKALIELEKFSLIKWDRKKKTLYIHRLIQTVVKDEMPGAELTHALSSFIDVCCESFPIVENELREGCFYTAEVRGLCRRYQSQMLEPLLRSESVRTEKCANIKERLANFLTQENNHNDAKRLRLQVIQDRIELLGIDHRDAITALHKLAWTYMMQGRIVEAINLQEEALERRTRTCGEEELEMLVTKHLLAYLYVQQGRLSESAKLNEEVTAKMKTTLGEEDSATLLSGHTLALVYYRQGRLDDAAKLEEEVMEKMKRILGEDNQNTLWAMTGLVVIYCDQDRLTNAARLAQELVDKNERMWGEDHWDTLLALNNLAMVYLKQGRIVEGATLQENVMEKWTRVSGGDHPYTLLAKSNLAWFYQCLERVDEGVRMLEDVLEKRKRVSGPEHPDTLGVMSNLALAYEKQGRIMDGIKLLEEALEKQKSTLGEAHPVTETMVKNLERMHQQLDGVDVQEEENCLETGAIPK
jgi:tetratricopeptide (TPR) repeat protein